MQVSGQKGVQHVGSCPGQPSVATLYVAPACLPGPHFAERSTCIATTAGQDWAGQRIDQALPLSKHPTYSISPTPSPLFCLGGQLAWLAEPNAERTLVATRNR